MEIVRLNNGSEEAMALVTSIMLSLRSLIQEDPIAFYELVMKCRNKEHGFFGNTQKVLQNLALVDENGGIHDSTRNIVLSAAVGEGLNLSLQSPIAE